MGAEKGTGWFFGTDKLEKQPDLLISPMMNQCPAANQNVMAHEGC